MIPAKVGSIWPRSFRGEDLFNISQSETRIAVRFSIKLLHMVPFGQQTWPLRAILFSDWLLLNKPSPLKLLGQIKLSLAGSIYARSSIKANQKQELLLVAMFVGQMEPYEEVL
jgi:hypothetical protein